MNNTGQDQGEKLPFNYTSASSPSSAEQSSSWVEEKSCLASHPGENGLIIDSMDPSRQDFCKLINIWVWMDCHLLQHQSTVQN